MGHEKGAGGVPAPVSGVVGWLVCGGGVGVVGCPTVFANGGFHFPTFGAGCNLPFTIGALVCGGGWFGVVVHGGECSGSWGGCQGLRHEKGTGVRRGQSRGFGLWWVGCG